MSEMNTKLSDNWRFARLGGFDQVEIQRNADFFALASLDQKLWATLSCPTKGLYFDQDTLNFLDTDKDGRIRVNEIIAAVNWVVKILKNPADLLLKKSTLPLSAINDADTEGKQLLNSAREILKNLGKPDAQEIGFAEMADMDGIFADTRFNGDGIIPVSVAGDNQVVAQLIENIIQCCGAEIDRSGEEGISLDKIGQFFADATLYNEWYLRRSSLVLNDAAQKVVSEASTILFSQLKTKIDDYFIRCQLAEFDVLAANALNPPLAFYEQLASTNLTANLESLASLPLATIAANLPLPLSSGVNPLWRDNLRRFKLEVLLPLFGELDSLSFSHWQTVVELFATYHAWLQEKPINVVERLGVEYIQKVLVSDMQATLSGLIAEDLALKEKAESIDAVDRLLHYYRDLHSLLNNFVSFRNFYNSEPHAIFQAGVLYLDGRSCQLCVLVDDISKHSTLASLSKIFIAYCTCSRPASDEIITIAAAVTDGDSDNLMVGRNGVFYDRKGQDWDATIVKIIDHPISIKQAFFTPYKRVARLINTQIQKSAAARDPVVSTNALNHLAAIEAKVEHAKSVTAKSTSTVTASTFDVGKFAGIFAAIGLAVGAVGTVLANIIGGFITLHWWQMPLAIVGLLLLISGPSMLIAYFNIRQRNLAPVLDAGGWAVNAKAFINIPFGRLLTTIAKLPKDAERQLVDPFGEKKKPWVSYFLLILLLVVAMILFWKEDYLFAYHDKHALTKAEPVVAEAAHKVDKPDAVLPTIVNPQPK